ncbi:MAG: DUF4136 domain-containing protein [Bacteroidota bacterium]
MRLWVVFFFLTTSLWAQDIEVEYDKNRDLTGYKTFRFGEGEIITPKDQRVIKDATMHQWVKKAIREELTGKGLVFVDSAKADLTASYIIGSLQRSDMQNLGPMGTAPGSTDQTWSRNFQQSSLIIDLNDRSNILIWRIQGVTTTTTPDAENMIREVVSKGFKKFSLKPKKEKKKKK